MINLQQKAEEMIRDRETFCQSTNHHLKGFKDNYRRFEFYRTDEITALSILYEELVLNKEQYKRLLTPDEEKEVFNEKLSLQRLVEWLPSPERLGEQLASARIVSLFTEERGLRHRDYLLYETAFVIVRDLDKIVGSIFEQFRRNTGRVREVLTEIFDEPHNSLKVDCLVWCYNQMAERIKQEKGWAP